MAFDFPNGGDAGHIDALSGCRTPVRIHFVDGSFIRGKIYNQNDDIINFYSDDEEDQILYKRTIVRIVTCKD